MFKRIFKILLKLASNVDFQSNYISMLTKIYHKKLEN